MKSIIFNIYLFYFKYCPIKRGKQFFAIWLSKIFGSNFQKTKNDLWIDIFLKSPQDTYLLNFNGSDVLTDIIKELNPSGIFIDIGANIGYYSFLASKHFGKRGKIFSFEPSYREYIRLVKGIHKNKLVNIIPFNACLSNFTGDLIMDIEESHTGLNKIQIIDSNCLSTNRVSVFKLDDIIGLFQLKCIDLIKIDVEGAEYLVILGMKDSLQRGLIRKVYVEITPTFLNKYGHTKENIYDFMSNCGFISTVNSDEWQYDEIFIFEKRNIE